MRQYLSNNIYAMIHNIHVTLDDNYVTVGNNYMMIDDHRRSNPGGWSTPYDFVIVNSKKIVILY